MAVRPCTVGVVLHSAFGGKERKMDYKTSWNLLGEVRERLTGRNGAGFAEDLGKFLKHGLGPPGAAKVKKRKKDTGTHSFAELLAACKQNWVHDDFTEEHFPLEPVAPDEADWEVYEHHFDREISGLRVFAELENRGYRLCGPRRAMEFVAENQDIQLDHPLIIPTCWKSHDGNIWHVPLFGKRYPISGGCDLILCNLGHHYRPGFVLFHDFDPDHGWLVLRRKPGQNLPRVLPDKVQKQRFVVADHFTTENPEVKIGFVKDSFREWFGGKVEEASAWAPKFHHDLNNDSLDEEVLRDLGGADKVEVTPALIYNLLKFQPNGEAGDLLTNGSANIFYAKDVDGILRAVSLNWYDDGWRVYALPVDDPHRWNAGYRVFFR